MINTQKLYWSCLAEIGKDRCGDQCAHFKDGDAGRLMMVVCDGVSSSPRGADAAQMACTKMEEHFRSFSRAIDSREEILSHTVKATHSDVRTELSGRGICCMVAALVDFAAGYAAIVNVGDTAAFFSTGRVFKQLTDIDRAVRVVRMNNENVLVNGVPLIQKGITQAIGQVSDVSLVIRDYKLNIPFMHLCLASDGVSGPDLRDFMTRHGNGLSQELVGEFCDEMRVSSKDDTTLMILQLGRAPLEPLLESLKNYETMGDDDRDRLLAQLSQESFNLPCKVLMECLIHEKSGQRASQFIKLLEKSRQPLPKDDCINLLNWAIQSGMDIKTINHLKQIIRVQMLQSPKNR